MNPNLFRRNDNIIEWQWLAQATDGSYVNDGTVSFALYSGYLLSDANGSRSGGTLVAGPITMAYVPGSNGKYQGKLPSTVNLNLALQYTLEINATANGHVARRSIPVNIIDRKT